MKVFWVLAWDQYYPNSDNFEKSFATREEAEAWVAAEQNHDHAKDHYKVIDVSHRLQDSGSD